MKKLAAVTLFALSLLFTSCGDSPESLVDDSKDLFGDLTEIVKGVNEGDDPEEAVEEIKAMSGDFKEFLEKMKTVLKDEFDDDEKAMEEKMGELMKDDEEFKKIQDELEEEMEKLMKSGKEDALKVVQALGELMVEMGEMQ